MPLSYNKEAMVRLVNLNYATADYFMDVVRSVRSEDDVSYEDTLKKAHQQAYRELVLSGKYATQYAEFLGEVLTKLEFFETQYSRIIEELVNKIGWRMLKDGLALYADKQSKRMLKIGALDAGKRWGDIRDRVHSLPVNVQM